MKPRLIHDSVKSDTTKEVYHVVRLQKSDGTVKPMSCTCVGWKAHKRCKHMERTFLQEDFKVAKSGCLLFMDEDTFEKKFNRTVEDCDGVVNEAMKRVILRWERMNKRAAQQPDPFTKDLRAGVEMLLDSNSSEMIEQDEKKKDEQVPKKRSTKNPGRKGGGTKKASGRKKTKNRTD